MTEAAVTPWYQGVEGIDAEMVGHLQNKGWDKLDAPKVAAQSLKAWKEAEKHIGLPADQIIRMPKDPANDPDGMKAVWQRLGAPKEAKDYDFTSVKTTDGKAPDEKFVEALRKTAFDLNLPKDVATKFAASLVKFNEDNDKAQLADITAKISEEKTALEKNWGKNIAANTEIAKRAAAALGIKPEDVTALESVVGFSRVMEMFRTIGTKIGEDKFVAAPQSEGGVMTREQAVARKAELQKDELWVGRYMKGGAAENREMSALIRIITEDGKTAV